MKFLNHNFIKITSIFLLSYATVKTTSAQLPPPPEGIIPMEVGAPGKLAPDPHIPGRLAVFAKEDISKLQNRTVFLGDSITQMFDLNKFFPEIKTVNRGVGYDGMGLLEKYGVYNRLASTVYNLHPKQIILMIGVNDIGNLSTDPGDKRFLQYDYLVWKLRHDLPNTELWCISLLPTGDPYSNMNPTIRIFNAHAEQVANKYHAHWLNIYPNFLNENNIFKKEYTQDGLHPSQTGFAILANIYRNKIFGLPPLK